MTKDEIIQKINNTKVCQIKVGETHGFRDIWVVVAEGRLFCRQYSFSKNSWRNALLENEKAYIKVDGNIVEISGKIPGDLDAIMQKVNEAYIEKYVHRLNYYPEIAQQAANLEKHQCHGRNQCCADGSGGRGCVLANAARWRGRAG